MRVLHVIGTLDPAAGGPPMVASRLAAAQAAMGLDVHVVTYGSAADATAHLATPGFDQVKVHAIDPPTNGERVTARAASQHVAAMLDRHEGPTILHLHGVWEPILRAAAAAARDATVPYALAPHGMLDPWSLSQRRWKKRLALAMGYRAMLDGAAFLHTLNRDECELLKPLALKPGCEVIPNGVFTEEIEPLPQAGTFRAKHPQLANHPFVLFLSRLHHKKGLDRLAAAFRLLAQRHAEVTLVVAGPDGGEQEAFERLIADAGLNERVHLVGPLWNGDKFAAMVDAACFCLPSRQEGFSVAITEAMACGCPVAITKACHFPEVAQHGAGFVTSDDDNAAELAEALEQLVGDSALRRRMGDAGAKLVRERFTWPQVAKLTARAYERALARHGQQTQPMGKSSHA